MIGRDMVYLVCEAMQTLRPGLILDLILYHYLAMVDGAVLDFSHTLLSHLY